MTQADWDAFHTEIEVDELLDDQKYLSPMEIAQGLIENPEEFGEAGSSILAAALRRRATGHSLAPMGKMAPAAPKPVAPPPIRSKPVKLAKPDAPRLI